MSYPYTSENRLISHNTYMYSAFKGFSFFGDYFRDRQAFLSDANSDDSGRDFLSILTGLFDLQDDMTTIAPLSEFDPTLPVQTNKLLMRLLIDFKSKQNNNWVDWLDRLVQRFEVTKKLYQAYQPGFRKGVGIYNDQSLYVAFSYLLTMYCLSNPHLKTINIMLKVNDTLVSVKPDLMAARGLYEVSCFSISRELSILTRLMKEQGIDNAID
jgi:hypothetical protein